MRVVHVFSVGVGEAGGQSYSVPRLCEALLSGGVDARLAALDLACVSPRPRYLETFPLEWGPRRLGFSPAMRRWLEDEAVSGRAEIIHSHGLWMMPGIYSSWACRATPCRIMVSPRGMLAQWALRHHALQKRIMWSLLQSSALRATACFHATSDREYEDIRRLGFKQPICILPNGIDVPPPAEKAERGRRVVLFLGRIHKIKGIDVLLRAWQAVEHRFPDWDLRIAGPDDGGFLKKMRELAEHLSLKHVAFCGPVFGDSKLRAYRDASLFVLPTHSENFGLTVAEALAAGTPAIVTKGAPWRDLEREQAGWWIDIGLEPLVSALERALAMPPIRLADMGRAGREWMLKDFSWTQIAAQFAQTYHWILDGGETPPWVRLD